MKRDAWMTFCALGLAAAACSDDGDLAVTLQFETERVPRLVAVQDGDGPWQAVPVMPDAPVTVEITAGYYGYVVVCASGTVSSASIRFDARERTIAACRNAIVVNGDGIPATVTPAGSQVFIGNFETFVEPDGSFVLAEEEADLDLVALHQTSARALIRRGFDPAAGPVTLDLLADGFDRLRAPVTVTGTAGGELTVIAELHTATTYVPMTGEPTSAWLIPASERLATDRMVVLADERQADRFRVIQHVVTGDDVPPLSLDDVPTPVLTADRTGATWTGEPGYQYAELREPGLANLRVFQGATPSWQVRSGRSALAWIDVTTLPGWAADWARFDPGDTLEWSVYQDHGVRDGEFAMVGRSGTLTW